MDLCLIDQEDNRVWLERQRGLGDGTFPKIRDSRRVEGWGKGGRCLPDGYRP